MSFPRNRSVSLPQNTTISDWISFPKIDLAEFWTKLKSIKNSLDEFSRSQSDPCPGYKEVSDDAVFRWFLWCTVSCFDGGTVGCVCHSLKVNLNSNDCENANSVLLDKRVNESSSTTHPSAILDQSIYYYHLTPLFLLELISLIIIIAIISSIDNVSQSSSS